MIWCEDREQYFSENSEFETLRDIENQLKSYHEIDVEGIWKMSLREICEAFKWEIHDTKGNIVENLE